MWKNSRMLAFLMIIICASAAVPAVRQLDVRKEDIHFITQFKKGNGIYYEYIANLKLSSTNWRVAVFVDIRKQNQGLEELIIKKKHLPESCSIYHKECLIYINNYDWNGQWEVAMELKTELENALTDLSRKNSNVPTELPRGTRVRRRTALLGFLGKIIGPVTGMLNYEDDDRINTAIQELNVAQANISHLVGQQTHVVRAQLDLLHKQGEIHEMELKQLKEALKNIMDETKRLGYDYTPLLNQIMSTISKKLQHYIKTGTKFLNVIYAARRGELHPALLTSHQLLPIMRDIQDHQAGSGIPIQGPNYSVDELIKISHTTIIMFEGNHLKILVDIPLTVEPLYSVYKLHPLPIFQTIVQNKTGKAYIDYKNEYIVIDDAQLTYMTMKQEDLNLCRKTSAYFLCQNAPVIYEAARNPSCEVQMLLQPSAKALKTCTIRIEYNEQPFWQRLETLGGWLYSVQSETYLHIKCSENYKTKVSISGAGLLQLAPGCIAKAPTITLPALQIQMGISEILYESNIELNLQKISPILGQWNDSAFKTLEAANLKEDTILKNEYFQNAETLDQLEQQLYGLSLQRQQRSQKWWTTDNYVNYLLIAAGVVAVIYYGYQLVFIFVKKRKHTISDFKNQDLEKSTPRMSEEDAKLSTMTQKKVEKEMNSRLEAGIYNCHCSALFDHT